MEGVMNTNQGMVLIMALVFLLVMSLLISAMLLVSQLSHKTAHAGQQQLQTAQDALAQHIMAVSELTDETLASRRIMANCPAQYAAWSEGIMQCEVLQLDTAVYSDSRHFYAGYSSLILKKTLIQGEN
jgi:Na+-transporting methylmalonyl-CoA/oxaloacetate decarboxylase gamma subunit